MSARTRPGHAPNCACPRCRHHRGEALHPRVRLVIYATALALGCALSVAAPPETTIPGFAVTIR